MLLEFKSIFHENYILIFMITEYKKGSNDKINLCHFYILS